MACDRIRPLLPRFADRALGPLRRTLVARHVMHCPSCATELGELESMRTAIRAKLAYHRAPPGLAARIGASLPREMPPAPARSRVRMPIAGFAATGLASALAGVALTLLVIGVRPNTGDSLTDAVVDANIRSLMGDHLTDVLTGDRHTVKPFLSAHLPVSPPVPELADKGFPLVGGRLDYIDGHPTAAVVYRRDKHVINLFAWASPDTSNQPFHTEQRQGFNVVTWRQGGVTYNAVSDVEADQLLGFAKLIAGT